jgi:hypothetical protein
MKNSTVLQTVELKEDVKEQLTKEVEATLATTDCQPKEKRNFTLADMWNSRKNSTSASSRIRRWSLS